MQGGPELPGPFQDQVHPARTILWDNGLWILGPSSCCLQVLTSHHSPTVNPELLCSLPVCKLLRKTNLRITFWCWGIGKPVLMWGVCWWLPATMQNWVLTPCLCPLSHLLPGLLCLFHTVQGRGGESQWSWHPQPSILSSQVSDRDPGFRWPTWGSP